MTCDVTSPWPVAWWTVTVGVALLSNRAGAHCGLPVPDRGDLPRRRGTVDPTAAPAERQLTAGSGGDADGRLHPAQRRLATGDGPRDPARRVRRHPCRRPGGDQQTGASRGAGESPARQVQLLPVDPG